MINTKFYNYFWIFMFGSVFGVASESLWRLVTRGIFVTRVGVIYGPFNPVYGIGLVLITLCLVNFSDRSILFIVFLGALLGGSFEYFTSVAQQAIFGTISWDYNKFPYTINGRINIPYTILWGLIGATWIKVFYPSVKYLISKIPRNPGVFITYILLLFMILNISISTAAVYRESERYQNIPPQNFAEIFLDTHYPDDFLHKIYPNMKKMH